MTTLDDKVILSGADNRSPMLEKDMYDFWKSIMELYMMNRQHGRMILESQFNMIVISKQQISFSKDYHLRSIRWLAIIKSPRNYGKEFNFSYKELHGRNKKDSEQVEAILGNEGLLFVTTAKEKAICPNNALNLRGNGMILDLGIPEGQATQTIITHNAAYLANDLDAYDSDCDELNTAKVAMPSSEQSNVVTHLETEINSDSNIIPYSQYVIESQQAAVQNFNSFAQQDALILSVIKQLKTQVVTCTKINMDNKNVNDTLTAELERYKEQNYVNSPEPTLFSRPTKVEVPKELPKVSMVNTSLKKLKYHLAVQNVFYQMEQSVEKHRVESKTFEVKMNQVLKENERLLEQVINKDIVNIIMNSSVDIIFMNVHECEKCLKLETELLNKKDFIEKEIYDKLFKSFTTLEKHCISLEVDTQLNQEIFQRTNSVSNQSAHSFDQLFELNELKAQSQEKDTSVEISDLNASLQERVLEITALKDDLRKLKRKALVDNAVTKHTTDPEMLKIDVEPITPKLLNKKTAHSTYIKHTQDEATCLRDLVEHVKSKYLLDHSLESACRYAKLIQKLLTHISKTCSSVNNIDRKLVVVTPKNKDKRVRFTDPITFLGNTITKTASTSILVSNKPMLSSTGVKSSTSASGSQPSDKTKKDKIQQTPSSTQKNKVEAHPRKVKSSLKNKDCVVQPKGTAHLQHSKLNANSELKCVKCNGCIIFDNHDLCVLDFINNVNARKQSKSVKKSSKRKVIQIVLWYLDFGCSKHMTGDRSQLTNFVNKFLGAVKFGNDNMEKIMGYVAFRQHTCFIYNLEGVDLLTGSRGNNLYTLSLGDMMSSSLICLLLKASQIKSWLWRRRLSHLNFGTINHLARHGLVQGLPKLNFKKDHLCSDYAMGKSKKKPHKPKSKDTNQEKLYLLHMDLCGPILVASVNGKKYILVIIDDYSQFTWVKCLRSIDEAPDFIIKFLKMIQVRLKTLVRRIRIDNGTEFVNQILREYYEKVGISHETSIALSPQQNGVIKRHNRTLIEAARTMLIYAKAPLFLWAEAVATACYT
ncbi:retrovirus-related pol polyprotein from transposon TNT 1-94 [Tanacetum coccineum]